MFCPQDNTPRFCSVRVKRQEQDGVGRCGQPVGPCRPKLPDTGGHFVLICLPSLPARTNCLRSCPVGRSLAVACQLGQNVRAFSWQDRFHGRPWNCEAVSACRRCMHAADCKLPFVPDLSRQFLRVESVLSEKISLPTSQSRSTAR